MNPIYQMLNGQTQASQPQFLNPIQKANYIMQAMTNPAAFVRQAIPDLPPEIANDPVQILQYLKQTRGFTDSDIRSAANSIPRFY
jgi:hypothetical protein